MTKSEWTLYYRELRKNKKAPSYDNYSSVILRNTYNSLALDYRARVKYNLITRYEGKVSERLKNEIMKSLGAIQSRRNMKKLLGTKNLFLDSISKD